MTTPSKNKSSKVVGPITVGKNVLIRTVTHYTTGKIVAVGEHEILLTNAAWIADTGRWSEALAKGTLAEVEAYPPELIVALGRGSIVDVVEWTHELPTSTK